MADQTSLTTSPLEVDHRGDGGSDDQQSQQVRLDTRIIDLVNAAPDRTIRPARLAAELGISVNDACAELCGLLSAVGGGVDGASFRFEKLGGQDVMVFCFPPDFEARARRKRRQQDVWESFRSALSVTVRVLKILTAFGLILSLLILCIAAVAALLAILVALSRDNRRGHHHHTIMRQVRALFFTIRQLLWFYAAFGPDSEGQHPFLREVAYDLSLILSCCCGNPGSLFWWIRARQLSRRRDRIARGWRSDAIDSEIEGVALIRRGGWGDESTNNNSPSITDEGYRGLLSTAVEFLFGPSSPPTDPSDIWKLRAAVIVRRSTENETKVVSLEAVAPYLDYPPASMDNAAAIVEQGLLVVAHFNGVPGEASPADDMVKAEFIFPELLAESDVSVQYEHSIVDDDGTWQEFLYAKEGNSMRISSSELPAYYTEERYRFTMLTSNQFYQCLGLGILNLVGVIWFGQAVSKGGLFEMQAGSGLATFLLRTLLPLLRGYALLFLALPATRLLFLLAINYRREKRNHRRQYLAKLLMSR